MRHEPGTRTEDLATIHTAPPGIGTGERIRRFGRRNYTTGITLAVSNIIGAFVVALLTEGKAFTSVYGVLLATIAHIAVMVLAGSFAIVGAQQATAERISADIDRNRRRLDQLAGQVHDQDLTVRSHVNAATNVFRVVETLPERLEKLEAALTGRLDAVEKAIAKVPDYGQAVLDGIEMHRNAVDPDRP